MAGHTNNLPFILFICTLTRQFSLVFSFCFSVINSRHFTIYLIYFMASRQISFKLSVNIPFDQWGNWGTKNWSNLHNVIDKLEVELNFKSLSSISKIFLFPLQLFPKEWVGKIWFQWQKDISKVTINLSVKQLVLFSLCFKPTYTEKNCFVL